MASLIKSNDYLRFQIPEEVEDWSLKMIMERSIKPEMREGRMIELGELFTEPLMFVTPRSEYDSQDPIQGKFKQNWFCQITIWKNRVNKENNMDENIQFDPTAMHIVEALCPTSMVLDCRTAEKLTEMNAPCKAKNDTKLRTDVTVETHDKDFNLAESHVLSYDWDNVIQFTGERNMRARGLILNEKEGLQDNDGKVEIEISQRMDLTINRMTVKIPAYKCATVAANYSYYGRKIDYSSKSLLAGFFGRLATQLRAKKQIMSPILTCPMIFGFDVRKHPQKATLPARVIITKGK